MAVNFLWMVPEPELRHFKGRIPLPHVHFRVRPLEIAKIDTDQKDKKCSWKDEYLGSLATCIYICSVFLLHIIYTAIWWLCILKEHQRMANTCSYSRLLLLVWLSMRYGKFLHLCRFHGGPWCLTRFPFEQFSKLRSLIDASSATLDSSKMIGNSVTLPTSPWIWADRETCLLYLANENAIIVGYGPRRLWRECFLAWVISSVPIKSAFYYVLVESLPNQL